MHVNGEMWLTPNWFLELTLRQHVFTVANNLSGSSPSSINASSLETDMGFGYNFLMTDDFWGPKFQLSFAYSKFAAHVDESNPPAYTSLAFSGTALGIGGSFPANEKKTVYLGGRLNYFFFPSVDESPVTSGSSSTAQMSSFSLFGSYKLSEHVQIRGEILYEMFSASFSGTGTRPESASSASHNVFTPAVGVEYLF